MNKQEPYLRRTNFRGIWSYQGIIWSRSDDRLSDGQEKRTCRIVDFAVPADHWVKLKEGEKRDKYLDLTRELKKTMRRESDGDICCNPIYRPLLGQNMIQGQFLSGV